MNAFILLGTVIFRGLLCFNKSVALICATSIDRRRILQWAHSSTRVFQVSEISIFFPEHVAPRKSNTVVWSGAMIPRKAPLLAVSIIAEVLRRSKDSDAIFIGDGELKNRTETAVAQLGSDIAQRIKFCGAVSPDMSRKVIASSSVLLVTSWREVNSFVVFEAMASNTKVVSMAISGMQDVVFMFGNVVDPNGSLIPEFADAVYHTLEDLVISDEQFKEVRAKVQRDEANEFQALIAWVEDGGIS
jgi:glycosyltransferase involved in cell wall biosynthesis